MAVAIAPAPPIPNEHMASKAHSCPKCGNEMSMDALNEEAQKRITELESQVEMLKGKAISAVDKCADFEDQLRNMQSTQDGRYRSDTTNSLQPTDRISHEERRPSTANSSTARQSRFSLFTTRRGSPSLPSSDPQLLEQLEQERALRTKAEERARTVDMEIEELSVSLFSQANEMVATERRARAKLEARVEQLEMKDKEKVARLDRLEKAVSRIDRVKAILATPAPAPLTT